MERSNTAALNWIKPVPVILDVLLLSFIYFVPAISHLFAFPVYLLEPMRIALVISLIFTNKRNTFLIALTIPLFSFVISSHPSIIKAGLIGVELMLNAALFYILLEKINNIFAAAIISITASKIFYYLIKFLLLQTGVMDGSLVSTPLYYQVFTTLFYSGLIYLLFNKIQNKQ